MTFYCSWVDILNVLEWEYVRMRMSVWQNEQKWKWPKWAKWPIINGVIKDSNILMYY